MIIDKPTFDIIGPVKNAKKWPKRGIGIPATGKGTMGLGYYLAVGPTAPPGTEVNSNQFCKINYTSPPGEGSTLLYKFTFQIPKWSYDIAKVDEWIEVSPTNKEYYDRTIAMKDQLANQIKQGLAQAANAISDYELINHDLRKYREIMSYFNDKTEHSLKAMFIDQVDIHNGNMSMVQMVQRWSTLIHDFQKLTDEDTDIDKISKKLNVPKAEAVVLKTKNLLYIQWKKLFKTAAVQRYERLLALAKAREKSIREYREWLKPHIVRFKRIRVGHSIEGARHDLLKSYTDITGQITFHNYIRFWAWKFLKPVEMRRAPMERTSEFMIDPWDDFVRENFVLDNKSGLSAIYPWLLGPYDPKNPSKNPDKVYADKLMEEIKKKAVKGLLAPAVRSYFMYYSFIDIVVDRLGIRTPSGEQEDITFRMKNYLFSQNILFLKLLELECRKIELNRYIDALLGLKVEGKEPSLIAMKEFPNVYGIKKEKEKEGVEKMLEEVNSKIRATNQWWAKTVKKIKKPRLPGHFMFFKPGPYEFDFANRINKGYLVPLGRHYHGVIEGFLKENMGVR